MGHALKLTELTDSVLSRGRAVSLDVRVHRWFVDHRVGADPQQLFWII